MPKSYRSFMRTVNKAAYPFGKPRGGIGRTTGMRRIAAKPRTRLPPLQSERVIPSDLRRAVLRRDGNACLICGARTNLELHHVVPVANGGATTANNLRTLCVRCHRGQQGQHTTREVRTVPTVAARSIMAQPNLASPAPTHVGSGIKAFAAIAVIFIVFLFIIMAVCMLFLLAPTHSMVLLL